MKAIERVIGSPAERAGQRIERARAEIARVDASLAERRTKRDALLLEDAAQSVVAAVRNEVRALERERGDLLEALEGAQRALAKAEADAAERELAGRWKRTAERCEARQAAAGRLEAAILEAAAAFVAMQEATNAINGCAPVPLPVRLTNGWHDELVSVAEGILRARTGGGLGRPDALGVYQPSEWLRLNRTVQSAVERQHRQLLGQQRSAHPEPKKAA